MVGRRGIAANDLIIELQSDPECIKVTLDREQQRERLRVELQRDGEPLVAALAEIGVKVGSVWDLVNTRGADATSIPVLTEHLSHVYRPETKEGIARALGVRDARASAWELILAAIPQENERRVRDGLFVALSGMATPRDLDTIIELASDATLGPSRVFLVRNLMRSKRPKARTALHALKNDPDLKNEIRHRLRMV